jgi:hypothetical protein
METLVDKHIMDGVLEYPLHRNQYAHHLENALPANNVVMHSESAVEHKETALAAFIHTEGAFNRASFDVII